MPVIEVCLNASVSESERDKKKNIRLFSKDSTEYSNLMHFGGRIFS